MGARARAITPLAIVVGLLSFGWTEFEIAPETETLTITTYGVPAYDPVEARVWLADARLERDGEGWALTTVTAFKAHWLRTRLSQAIGRTGSVRSVTPTTISPT